MVEGKGLCGAGGSNAVRPTRGWVVSAGALALFACGRLTEGLSCQPWLFRSFSSYVQRGSTGGCYGETPAPLSRLRSLRYESSHKRWA